VDGMSDPVEDFFTELGRRGYEPLLQHIAGSIRFDVHDGDQVDHWWIGIDQGRITVEHADREAKSVAKEDRATLTDIVLGRRNALTTLLQGNSGYTGDGEPLVVFQRMFPDGARTGVAP
jgi:hypothetical protein